jgi:hypothetical protein
LLASIQNRTGAGAAFSLGGSPANILFEQEAKPTNSVDAFDIMVNASVSGTTWAFTSFNSPALLLRMDQTDLGYWFYYAPAAASGAPAWQTLAQLDNLGRWSTAGAHRFRYLVSGARVRMTANNVIPASAGYQTLPWNVLQYDTDGIWVSPNFVAPVAGYYECEFAAQFYGTLTTGGGLMLVVSGTPESVVQWSATGVAGEVVTWQGLLAAGATVQPQVYNANVACTVQALTTWCAIRYIGE